MPVLQKVPYSIGKSIVYNFSKSIVKSILYKFLVQERERKTIQFHGQVTGIVQPQRARWGLKTTAKTLCIIPFSKF